MSSTETKTVVEQILMKQYNKCNKISCQDSNVYLPWSKMILCPARIVFGGAKPKLPFHTESFQNDLKIFNFEKFLQYLLALKVFALSHVIIKVN